MAAKLLIRILNGKAAEAMVGGTMEASAATLKGFLHVPRPWGSPAFPKQVAEAPFPIATIGTAPLALSSPAAATNHSLAFGSFGSNRAFRAIHSSGVLGLGSGAAPAPVDASVLSRARRMALWVRR